MESIPLTILQVGGATGAEIPSTRRLLAGWDVHLQRDEQ